ncbi:MAG: hypothetical protein Q8Q42_04400 [Nanoarchaeota archaeon]|nr:hypothetical protein [Nanoarchaeota archaeon]
MIKNVIDTLSTYREGGSFVGFFETILERTTPYTLDMEEFSEVLDFVDRHTQESEALDCVLSLADWYLKNEGDEMRIYDSWKNLKNNDGGKFSERMKLLLSYTG